VSASPGWTLVVLAAGMGSRYGGVKQLEPFGPAGEALSDYALRDAARAGATKAIFIIRVGLEEAFVAHHARVRPPFPVRYVHQDLSSLPEGRAKPWGTTHAVLAAAPILDAPFAVVNADDWYGPEAYGAIASFLQRPRGATVEVGLVGYRLRATLSEHGGVSRGVIETDADGRLVRIREVAGLKAEGEGVKGVRGAETLQFSGEEPVSMNCWVFPTFVLPMLASAFDRFVAQHGTSATAECPLPDTVQELVTRGEARVSVLEGGRQWFGVTHPADRPAVVARLRALQTGDQ
jgi:NDP-sugar pyrophosphorylase family protein